MKNVIRIPPVPPYDVRGTEQWLEQMARKGLHLAEDGVTAEVCLFRKGAPKKTKYRLQPAQKQAGPFDANNGEPDAEARELCEAEGWEYAARRGQFYIYRSDAPAVELDTDPAVRAIALNAVKKRFAGNAFWTVMYLALWLFLRLKGLFISMFAAVGTPEVLLTVFVFLAEIICSVRGAVWINRLRHGPAEEREERAKPSWLYPAARVIRTLLTVCWFILIFITTLNRASGSDRVPLEEYGFDVPFATLQEIFPGDLYDPFPMQSFNYVIDKRDVLTPVNIEWDENADVLGPEGKKVDAGLDVTYVNYRFEFMAKRAAKEALQWAKRQKYYEPEEINVPGVDFVAAYRNHFMSVILRRGRTVMVVQFYTTGANKVPTEYWIERIAEGME